MVEKVDRPKAFEPILRKCSVCGDLCWAQECIKEPKCYECFMYYLRHNYNKVKGGRICMVDMGEFEDYLNDKCAKENDIVEITAEGIVERGEKDGKKTKIFNMPVLINGAPKIYSPGKTARDALTDIFGSADSKDWIGKKFAVSFIKMQVKGVLKNVIIPKKI